MRLSDAIREGCRYTTKAREMFFGDDVPNTACALGAAVLGYNHITYDNITTLDLARVWPELTLEPERAMVTTCPDCGELTVMLCLISDHLNDRHDWPREAIADFIETLSIDLTPAPVVREAVPA